MLQSLCAISFIPDEPSGTCISYLWEASPYFRLSEAINPVKSRPVRFLRKVRDSHANVVFFFNRIRLKLHTFRQVNFRSPMSSALGHSPKPLINLFLSHICIIKEQLISIIVTESIKIILCNCTFIYKIHHKKFHIRSAYSFS